MLSAYPACFFKEDEGYSVIFPTVDVDKYAKNHFEKAVKKTLTIPAWLNDAAEARFVNFSQTLQDALKNCSTLKWRLRMLKFEATAAFRRDIKRSIRRGYHIA